MTKLTCPACDQPLTRLTLRGRAFFACADDGLMVRAADLAGFLRDQRVAGDVLNQLGPNVGAQRETFRRCPSCARAMRVFQTATFGSLDVDVCGRCRVYWFDRGEWEQVRDARFAPLRDANAAPPRRPGVKRAPAGESALQIHLSSASPLEYLGLPVGESTVVKRNPPFATYLLTFASLGFTAALRNAPTLGERWAFDPRAPFAHYGLTTVSSMLTHANVWHWLGNAYFLWMVGPDLEEEEGPAALLLLCLTGAVIGDVAYSRLGFTVPSVGLSGGIATFVVYWACRYPRNRVRLTTFSLRPGLGLFTPIHHSVSAPLFAMLFFAKDLSGLAHQLHNPHAGGGVNYVAHVAGAIVGFLAWQLRTRET